MMDLFFNQIIYADSMFDTDTSMNMILYIVCGLFIGVGILLVVIGRFGGNKKTSGYDGSDEKKHEIAGLVGKDEIEKIKEEKFNPDSIFKTIPTFSKNKFLENISDTITSILKNCNYEEVKDKIEEDTFSNLEKRQLYQIIILKKEITDFKEDNDKYIITSNIEVNYIEKKEEEEKHKDNYKITSICLKSNSPVANCPNCGGKIKDPTLLRCSYCDCILPNIENKKDNHWVIEDITKNS